MTKNLVIVESPAKAKTIGKFLGKDFQVESSFGHIADLPSKELGVDVTKDFKPKYQLSEDKKEVFKKLKSLVNKTDIVWLASDEDREGEAIAWHLFQQLKLKELNTRRIAFHEITKNAILKAIENPRSIDYNLVNAQQARRVLDRLVGYGISPILWKKIKPGLSAGRVQSVAVRLVVERESSIIEFKPEASYKATAVFINTKGQSFKALVSKPFDTKKDAKKFLDSCALAEFKISDLHKKPSKKSPVPPFTTSTLQQEASRKLGFPVAKTMTVAQRLYEAGLITYMRTDSVNLSKSAKNDAKSVIISNYGAEFSQPRNFTTKNKAAQEAHEAIRPTNMWNQNLSSENSQVRLYELIWKRTIASQMSDALLECTSVKIQNNQNNYLFSAKGEIITFEGFLKVYLEGTDYEEEDKAGMLPALYLNEKLSYSSIRATEKYTHAPYRFTEASLVKKLEELGIGRPSTYAPTISTVLRRNYVEKREIKGVERKYSQLILKNKSLSEVELLEKVGSGKGKLVPTDIGNIVNDFLVSNFKEELDYGFTAKVETDFDNIAKGTKDWVEMIRLFYDDFNKTLEYVDKTAQLERGERILGKDPKTGKTVLVRLGRFGPIAQIGNREDDQKQFASLLPNQNLKKITLKEALNLFLLPKNLGLYKDLEVILDKGRYGFYIKYDKMNVSIPKNFNPLDLTLEEAISYIDKKIEADTPIDKYQGHFVQKGTGRFGPFIKWNSIFINVSKKYNFDNLSHDDIVELIENKKKKEREKIIHNWEKEGIRIEKARWGRFNILKGKTRIELAKTVNASALTLDQVKKIIQSQIKPKKKAANKK